MAKNNIQKYLSQYAEPEVVQLDSLFPLSNTNSFDFALVIPAYKESIGFIETLIDTHLADESILLILVINQPMSEQDSSPQSQLHRVVLGIGNVRKNTEQLSLVHLEGSQSAVLVVDRFTLPIEDKLGVGLARKIGCDISLSLYQSGIVKTQFIGSTDADAALPSDYFNQLANLDFDNSFAVFNFYHHSVEPGVHQANKQYEKALRYFVAGLNYAGSAHAHYTIGSLLAINLEHYAVARGFPKRSAGEDFYLLNKLAKTGKWKFLKSSVVRLTARISDRVPFGTGPTVGKIIELNDTGQAYCYYHPRLFENLKSLLVNIESLDVSMVDVWTGKLDSELYQALQDIGFEKFCQQNKETSQIQFKKQLSVWFDNFKTLKFIHAMRENNPSLKNIPLDQAIKLAPFTITDCPVGV